MELIKFSKISDTTIREKSGIYAWYYSISLGEKDISDLITKLRNKEANRKTKFSLVSQFLDRHFYQFFKESNYKVKLSGKLMPNFEGEILHVSQSSNELIEKIIESPIVLWEIKLFLSDVSIDFSSPIYIGMAENLQIRLKKHKSLIDEYRKNELNHLDLDDRDENFAARVAARKMLTKNLFVTVQYTESEHKLHNILENLINRINYPVLGRN